MKSIDNAATFRWLKALFVGFLICAGSLNSAASEDFIARSPSPNKALIYIIREPHFRGSANAYNLYANGDPVARLTNGGYYDFEVTPGDVEFGIIMSNHFLYGPMIALTNAATHNKPDHISNLNVKPGETYFLSFKIGMFMPNLEVMDRDKALRIIGKLQRFDTREAQK